VEKLTFPADFEDLQYRVRYVVAQNRMPRNRSLLKEPAESGCRRVALLLLRDTDKAAASLCDPTNPEALHDYRVSVRRLRAFLGAARRWLRGSGAGKARKRFAEIMNSTNAGRDNEVHLAWIQGRLQGRRITDPVRRGLELMRDKIVEQSEGGQKFDPAAIGDAHVVASTRLQRRLQKEIPSTALTEAEAWMTFATAIAMVISERATALYDRLNQLAETNRWEEAHHARLEVKQLRYVLEPVARRVKGGGAAVRQLQRLQQLLGETHDLQLFDSRIEQVMRTSASAWSENLCDAARHARALPMSRSADEHLGECHALAALLRAVGNEQRRLLKKLQAQWIGRENEAFFSLVDQIMANLDPSAADPPAIVSTVDVIAPYPMLVRSENDDGEIAPVTGSG